MNQVHRKRSNDGMTMVELMIVMAIMVVSVSIFSQIVTSTSRIRTTTHERAIASEAARAMVEVMRNEKFDEVFVLFNASKTDDPGGQGTAPGFAFAVDGLDPQEGDQDGLVGEIFLPQMFVLDGTTDTLRQAGLEREAVLKEIRREAKMRAPAPVQGTWMLREDVEMPELGMPRDLNGDGVVDDLDHRGDAEILPICVRIAWKGRFGERSLEVYSLLTNYDLGESL